MLAAFVQYFDEILKDNSAPYNNMPVSDYNQTMDFLREKQDDQSPSLLFVFLEKIKPIIENPLEWSILENLIDHAFPNYRIFISSNLLDIGSEQERSIFTLIYACRMQYGKTNCSTTDLWIPDFSFLMDSDRRKQAVLGKRGPKAPLLFSAELMLPMKKSYWSSDHQPSSDAPSILYTTSAQKKAIKIRKTKVPFVLKRDIDDIKMPEGGYLYAMSMHGGLNATKMEPNNPDAAYEMDHEIDPQSHHQLHHSTFRAGQPVLTAGSLGVNNQGNIYILDRSSGHYLASEENLFAAAAYLLREQFISPECELYLQYTSCIHMNGLPILKDKESARIKIIDLLENPDLTVMDSRAKKYVDEMRTYCQKNPKALFRK